MKLRPVILAGGGGTRLWPLSREHYPKQFLRINSNYSLLQNTLLRIVAEKPVFDGSASLEVSSPLIICNEEHRFLVLEQADEIGIPIDTIILEPIGKNTAPALTCAALDSLTEPETILLMMPADHVIDDVNSFRKAVQVASLITAKRKILTLGIVPKSPETGYGYIKKGENISNNAEESHAFKIKDFVEKPDSEKAKQYLDSENYLWNSGLFMMQVSTWLDAIERYRPDILSACKDAIKQGSRDGVFFRLGRNAFCQCPADSIDYAVMEKISATDPDKAVVISLDAGWSDVGSWSSVFEDSEKNGNGNVITGDVVADDTSDSLLFSESRLVAAIGCSNLIVVETADAVLVADKNSSQGVKKIVEKLKETSREERLVHKKVYRPWGHYEGLDSGLGYQVKRLTINSGKKLSLQMHKQRAEHWVVVNGKATVTRDDETYELLVNESTYIAIGAMHRLENRENEPLEVIEVQSGDYLGEDDIVRFDDDFGRETMK